MNKGSKTALYLLVVVLVALGSYGLGFATPYVTGQARTASPGSNGTTAGTQGQDPSTPTGQADQPAPELPSAAQGKDIQQQFDTFWKTFQAINEDYYYRPVDNQQMIYGATKGMVESLGDDFSAYLTPAENEVVQSSFEGNFEGVGM